MANIDVFLAQILAATYGEEVRGSIHDAIKAISNESEEAKTNAEGYRDSAKYYAELAATWSEHPPYIGDNGNWFVYDIPTQKFKDSGIDADRTLTIQDITMLAEDANPYVTNTGTNTDPIYHLFIPRGNTGNGIDRVEKTNTSVLSDTYTIYYTDGNTAQFVLKNGKGISRIERTSTDNLTDTYTITYNDNSTSTFTVANGNGISSVEKKSSSGLVDTYEISYTDGTKSEFTITNGKSISGIAKTASEGLTDTYRISYNDGTHFDYSVLNGRSITKVEKKSSDGRVDTYRITFNDDTYFEYTVSNGKDGDGSVTTVNEVEPVNGNVTIEAKHLDIETSSGDKLKLNSFLAVTEMSTVLDNSKWDDNKYSFETDYPSTKYILGIRLNTSICTEDEMKAYKAASFYNGTDKNILECHGKTPQIDIPIRLSIRRLA